MSYVKENNKIRYKSNRTFRRKKEHKGKRYDKIRYKSNNAIEAKVKDTKKGRHMENKELLSIMLKALQERTEQVEKENKILKSALLGIEKAMLEYRLNEVNSNISSINILETLSKENHKCSCKQEEIDVPRPEPEEEKTEEDISEAIDTFSKTFFPDMDLTDPIKVHVESTPVNVRATVAKKKPRKERGGSVFKDFETLSLSKNGEINYDGNSIIFTKEEL